MSDEEKFDWTTVWVLTSIHLAQNFKEQKATAPYEEMVFHASLKKYKNLFEIVYMGDAINRAIFTNYELIDGIKRLTNAGFITEQNGFLLTTQKFDDAYTAATKTMKHVSVKDGLRIIARILKTRLPSE